EPIPGISPSTPTRSHAARCSAPPARLPKTSSHCRGGGHEAAAQEAVRLPTTHSTRAFKASIQLHGPPWGSHKPLKPREAILLHNAPLASTPMDGTPPETLRG